MADIPSHIHGTHWLTGHLANHYETIKFFYEYRAHHKFICFHVISFGTYVYITWTYGILKYFFLHFCSNCSILILLSKIMWQTNQVYSIREYFNICTEKLVLYGDECFQLLCKISYDTHSPTGYLGDHY